MTRMIDNPNRFHRVLMTGLVIILSGALAAGCSVTNASGNQAKSVKIEPAAKQKMDNKQELDADVVSSSQVNIITKVGGDVLEMKKKRGDTVQQGEVIFTLDSADAARNREKTELSRQNLQAQLDKTREDIATNRGVYKNTIEKLQLTLADLEKSYNNIRNDYDAGLVPKSQLDKAETQLKTTRLDLDTAQKQLANLEATDPLASLKIQIESTNVTLQDIDKTLSDFEVKAPISGILTDLNPEAGVTVPAGYVAGVIQQQNPIKIHADVTESALKLVRGKQELPFTLQGSDAKMTGTVTYLAEVMSPQSKTYVLELSAPNADLKLKSGMRVKLQLGGDASQDVVTVPASAITKEGNDNYVFVVSNDLAEKRKVVLGRTAADSSREVVSGVKEGEPIVVLGAQELKDKDKVEVRK
ncbi:efflux RND transporter periplasmic adaptor subunit [Paenibacillus sp. OAS669]|uniref:efflux RND transporter periplasmic adaptor subunit n=1 Tax=Paenibacillus sp. OAS669 TaxID=2663821 RepID=UPI0017895D95|nr:efflux RND transporter periplasmic adaptor subunit [Paenibacillus sp. OAS669]MBE1440672.1 multidrug efflux pump subunit AcrA (membrane-fusion protein) [Paenibacillus sp. OAS669]